MNARRRLGIVFELLTLVLALLFHSPPCPGQTAVTYHARADQALQSFLLKFWNGSQQYLRGRYPSDGSTASYWTYSHGWDAVMDGVERTGGLQYYGLIESFYLGQNSRGWYSSYYDDECWMTLALLRAHDLTADPRYLAQAQLLYADIMTGWDTNCCGSVRGGLWWDKAHTQKATAANAGAALAGARLYRQTGNASYLSFAQQVYSFWLANMVNTSTGQVCDHINPDGTKVWWRFTYNEGLMIGASVELNEATGTAAYLANAHRIASYMMGNEVTSTSYGPVLYDGSNTGCGGDCHQFKGPACRYLSRLYSRDPRTQYYNVLKASADAVWSLARETNTTIFSVNWAGPPQTNVDQPQMNAACMALNRFAQIQGSYAGPGTPPNQYEAENAVLRYLGPEAIYGPFTGWGYVAAWNSDGQSVEFKIDCATAGPHTLTLRYAAGAGEAFRSILVNGAVLVARQSFAATADWPAYRTVAIPCNLPVGPSSVSVVYDAARSSANWLNLDNLVVTGDLPEQIHINNVAVSPTGTVSFAWNSRPRHLYRLQALGSLGATNWTDLGSWIIASNSASTGADIVGTNRTRFYRVFTPY